MPLIKITEESYKEEYEGLPIGLIRQKIRKKYEATLFYNMNLSRQEEIDRLKQDSRILSKKFSYLQNNKEFYEDMPELLNEDISLNPNAPPYIPKRRLSY